MPAVSVVIPARDSAATLGATLDALAAQEVPGGFEVIVVDDGSTDSTVALVTAHPVGARVVQQAVSGGAAAARNAGAAAASAEVLAFTDADCAPAVGWLAAGLNAIEDADLVQGRITPTPGVPVGPFDRSLWVAAEHGLYESANVFVRRALFERLGGFEDFVRADASHDGRLRRLVPTRPFGEDTWLGWRARRAGARTTFSAHATVHHAVFPGDARGYVVERVRARRFPLLVRRIPELRGAFLWRRLFLQDRSAAFDLAIVGGLVALVRRRPAVLLAAVPYAVLLRKEVRKWGWTGPAVWKLAVVVAAGDAVTAAALAMGSAETRTPVL